MSSISPIVDCGVHYVDVMCQMTRAKPVRVSAIGARLSDELEDGMYTYGQLQVTFDDGSVGWYEAGWGPMMSDTAFFVKDVVSPNGAVSIRMPESARSDDIDTHTRTSLIRLHRVGEPDQDLSMADEPGHQDLCDREAAFVARAITEDLDLGRHLQDAVASLRVCLAADESVRTGETVKL
jgi:predicted dehydrogenase